MKPAPLLLGLVAVTAGAGFAAPVRAQEAAAAQLQVTSTTVVEQHTDNQDDATDNDDYGIVVQRLNLGAVSNGLEFTGTSMVSASGTSPPPPTAPTSSLSGSASSGVARP